jgi:transposase
MPKTRDKTLWYCSRVIQVKHLPLLDTPVYLRIYPARYQCDNCEDNSTTTETYDWCSKGSNITNGLEKYLMRNLIHSTVQGRL